MGLGKPRSKLGAFLDSVKMKQRELEESCGLSRHAVIDLCSGGKDVYPHPETRQKVISALRRKGHDVRADDFWG